MGIAHKKNYIIMFLIRTGNSVGFISSVLFVILKKYWPIGWKCPNANQQSGDCDQATDFCCNVRNKGDHANCIALKQLLLLKIFQQKHIRRFVMTVTVRAKNGFIRWCSIKCFRRITGVHSVSLNIGIKCRWWIVAN